MTDLTADIQKHYKTGYNNPGLSHLYFGIVGAENIAAYRSGQSDKQNLAPRAEKYDPMAYDRTCQRIDEHVTFEHRLGDPVEARFFELTTSGPRERWRRGIVCSEPRDGAIGIEFDDGTRLMVLNSQESINWRWCHD